MRKKNIIILIIILVIVIAFIYVASKTPHIASLRPTEPITPITQEVQPNEAVYEVTLKSAWSEDRHPEWYPSGAHLSPFVAWSHNRDGQNSVWSVGGFSTVGFEDMAETGATDQLLDEIATLRNQGYIHDTERGNVFFVPGESTIRIRVSQEYPLLTGVSMIAPSPDWFITFQDIELYKDGEWMESANISPIIFDAGTDSGDTFTANDIDTQPREPISLLSQAPTTPIAHFIITRIQE